MTREEAIEVMKAYRDKVINSVSNQLDGDIKAFEMAIQALSQEQISLNDINNALGASFRNGVRSAKVEQEPCEDAISREAVCNIVNDIRDCISVEGYCAILERLKKLPPVTQKSTEHFIDGVHAMGYREGYKDAQKQKSGK